MAYFAANIVPFSVISKKDQRTNVLEWKAIRFRALNLVNIGKDDSMLQANRLLGNTTGTSKDRKRAGKVNT